MVHLGGLARLWRTGLHVFLSALMVAVAGVVATPVAQAAAVTATLSVDSTWQTGFIARFTIANLSRAPLTGWVLEFDMPVGQSISHTWSSSFSQSGTHFVITPANWNRIIAPGGTANGGIRGVLNGSFTPPSNCMLNRQYRCS